MVQMSKDRVTGIIGIGLGALLTIASLGLPSSPVPDDPGPTVFPILAAAIMFLSGAALVVRKSPEEKKNKPYFTKEEWIRFAKIFGVYVLYYLLLWLFGYFPSTIVSLFIVSCLFLEGKKVVIWKQILFAVVITFILYFCFQQGLGIILPDGKLFRLASLF